MPGKRSYNQAFQAPVSGIRPFMPPPSSGAVGTSGASAVGSTDENSRIRDMMAANVAHWEKSQQEMPMQQMGPKRLFRPVNFRGPAQAPPENYVCFRCGEKGHFIQFCPTNADPNFVKPKLKRTTGIPKSFLRPVAPGSTDAATLVTPEGNLVIAAPNQREWERLATIKSLAESIASIPSEEIPDDLKCDVCHHLLNDAVKTPCCDGRFCDDCLRRLCEDAQDSTKIPCPSCKKVFNQDHIAPDPPLRRRVKEFIDSRSVFNVPEGEESTTEPDRAQEDDTHSTRKTPPIPLPFPGMMPPPFPFMPPPPFMGMMPPPFFFPPPIPSTRPQGHSDSGRSANDDYRQENEDEKK